MTNSEFETKNKQAYDDLKLLKGEYEKADKVVNSYIVGGFSTMVILAFVTVLCKIGGINGNVISVLATLGFIAVGYSLGVVIGSYVGDYTGASHVAFHIAMMEIEKERKKAVKEDE